MHHEPAADAPSRRAAAFGRAGRALRTAHGSPHPAGRRRRGLALLAALSLSVAALGLTGATAASAAAKAAAVLPVSGDRFAPPGTSVTFEGVTVPELSGLQVVGSVSGAHSGKLTPLVGSPTGGEVFTPTRSFAPGETVTVTAPQVELPGGGHSYSFGVSVPAPPKLAAKALATVTAGPQGSASQTTTSTTSGHYAPPSCPRLTYRSEPALRAQRACENLGVKTSGTQPGNLLFLTPGGQFGAGEGIYQPNGDLVWWQPSGTGADHNLSVVHYNGQPYLAVWSGRHAGAWGQGVVKLYNDHYQLAGEITEPAANKNSFPPDSIDLHEFRITAGGDALVGIFDPVTQVINGNSETVMQYVVQKLSLQQNSSGFITSASVLFEWDSLSGVPVTASHIPNPGAGGVWDYFHGNAISQDSDGNLIVSSRNTWGIYKIGDIPGSAGYGKIIWQVGSKGAPQLKEPWCYQHDISALGHNRYSVYDDGGQGPGCIGTSQHPARGLIFTVNPSTNPPGLTLDASYTHSPPIYTDYTGSTELMANGDVVIDWANVPEITEYGSSQKVVKMDLSLSNWSYRGFSDHWVGLPLSPPSVAASATIHTTQVWMSWNGATTVVAWQVLAGPSDSQLAKVGAPTKKSGFQTSVLLKGDYRRVEVQALNSSGTVIGTSKPVPTSGYDVAAKSGSVYNLGNATWAGSAASRKLSAPVTAIATTPDQMGYWLASSAGNVYNFGDAGWYGSRAGKSLPAPVVGTAATSNGRGYWIVTSKGNVYNFGDAGWYGSLARKRLPAPVVAMATTPDGRGYWLVTSKGNVYNFGDAGWYGSLVRKRLPAPVVGVAVTPAGRGYWLVTSKGNVYNFGNAGWCGSTVRDSLPSPVVAMARTPGGHGYWLVTAGGRTYHFGTAPTFGPVAGGAPASALVSMAGA